MLYAILLFFFISKKEPEQVPEKEKPCEFATGMIGLTDWDTVVLYFANPTEIDNPYASIWYRCYHENGEIMPDKRQHLIGRYAKICIIHSYKHCSHTAIIIGGLLPDDLNMTVAVEEFVNEVLEDERRIGGPKHDHKRKMTLPEALVNIGLASNGYYTREAADRAIHNMGVSALSALLKGSKSRDLEVKIRCQSLIYRLLIGDPPPILPEYKPIPSMEPAKW